MNRVLRNSEIEWIGTIPSEWSIGKIKYTTYVKGRIGWQGLKSDEFIDEGPYLVTGTDFNNRFVNWKTCHHISEERYNEAPPIQLKENDLLITKDGTIGKTAIVKNMPDKAVLNSGIFVTRSNKYEVDFMYWLLNSQVFDKYIKYFETGSTIKHLYQETFENFSFPLPEMEEQKKICSFLNSKINDIDKLIEDKKKIIVRLEKLRQSIITEAVTKGLNPNVKMKDSGVEWIGEIPEHWKVASLTHASKITRLAGYEYTEYWEPQEDGEIIALRGQNIGVNNIQILGNEERISETLSQRLIRSRLFKGDVVFPCVGSIGKAACIYENDKYHINQNIAKLTPNDLLDSEYLTYYLNSDLTKFQIKWYNTSEMQPSVLVGNLRKFKITLPSIAEQKAIIESLKVRLSEIDTLIDTAKVQIDKIKEYRQALIYEAVTGKIDIRDMELD